jgi:hypothetical protein
LNKSISMSSSNAATADTSRKHGLSMSIISHSNKRPTLLRRDHVNTSYYYPCQPPAKPYNGTSAYLDDDNCASTTAMLVSEDRKTTAMKFLHVIPMDPQAQSA